MYKNLFSTLILILFIGCGSSSDSLHTAYSWDNFSFNSSPTLTLPFDDNASLSFATWAIGGSDTMFTTNNISTNGKLTLTLKTNTSYANYTTTGAEARTAPEYGYGRYEILMKPTLSDGYVNSFFLFWDNSDLGTSWNEIDIEFIKADNQVQLNYWDKPGSSHEKLITLDFNASQSYHTYTIEYMPNYIKWYVDTTLLHTVSTNLPATQRFKIMMNLWKPMVDASGNSWAGTPDDTKLPISSSYDSLKYFPLNSTTNSNPHNCQKATSLQAWGLCTKQFMPDDGSNIYEVPSSTTQTAFFNTLNAMLNGDCSQALESSLQDNYALFTLNDSDTNESYCILSEVVDSDKNGKIDKGWGSIVVNQKSSSRLALEIPHPLYDSETLIEGITTFKHTKAKVLLLAGTHRFASHTNSSCQSSYKVSDVVHDDSTTFFTANKAIKEYFELNSSDYTIVQLHGKTSTSCSDTDSFLSNGVSDINGTKVSTLVSLIKSHYQYATPSSHATNSCTLQGTTNIEGRWINNVSNVCSTTSSSDSLHFIHIEQDSNVRDGLYWVPIFNTLN